MKCEFKHDDVAVSIHIAKPQQQWRKKEVQIKKKQHYISIFKASKLFTKLYCAFYKTQIRRDNTKNKRNKTSK